jgi:hypothetical protein
MELSAQVMQPVHLALATKELVHLVMMLLVDNTVMALPVQ